MEQTLVLIKPDAVKRKLTGKIIDRFEAANLKISALKLIRLNQQLLDTWYAHHKDKPFFPSLCSMMMETPVVAMILEGDNAVNRVRDLIGPTDSTIAPKGTIRGDWGESKQRNLVHASDGVDRAKFEIGLIFNEDRQ